MIYFLEDDNNIRNFVIYALNNTGLEAEGFETPEKFWEAMKNEMPDLLLLDIMLPGEDGISILKKIRNNGRTRKLPVIMLTAKGTEYDKVIGLDLGADDYLAKPFGMMEMISRVKAVLRRTSRERKGDILSFDGIVMNTKEHTVTASGERVELTLKEFELLKLFLSNTGVVFDRDSLLLKIWGNDFVGETRTVDVHIGTLRTKLGALGDCIKTVRGVGYKMEARV